MTKKISDHERLARERGRELRKTIPASRDAELDARLKHLFETPTEWPRWPIMPVKRRRDASGNLDWNDKRAFGFVVADNLTRVYFGLIFGRDLSSAVEKADPDTYTDYDSVDSLLRVYQVD